MSKVLITGAKGYLSSQVKDYLISCGISATNISLRDDSWRHADLSGYDTIVHIAGLVPKPGVRAEYFFRVNRDLTASLAQKAKCEGVKHFIYISSMAVYGATPTLKAKNGIINRETVCQPTSDYGKSKFEAEEELKVLEGSTFSICIIRVPSIYDDTKTEYFEQYKLILNKFYCNPKAFSKCHRSAIHVTNLCELIRLVIVNQTSGIICPDDGPLAAYDYCKMIAPKAKSSRLVGLIIESVLRKHPMIPLLFGAIAYDTELTNIFDGAYRITSLKK